MTEYVTQNIHTVLKKYQSSAPKSLQGPGHALVAAAAAAAVAGTCPAGGLNCPLDATIASGGCTDLNVRGSTNTLTPCTAAPHPLPLPPNGITGSMERGGGNGNNKIVHCPSSSLLASSSATSLTIGLPAAGQPPSLPHSLPPPMPLIKKEILSSPEPHELNESTPSVSLTLPLPLQASLPPQLPPQHQPPTIKIVPPPPPELSQPILSAADTGSGELHETRLEGKTIGCFSLGGEMRLCLPQFLNNVLADFTLDQINRIFDELGIFCSQCTPDQLMEFKAAKILPSDVKASGLITRTDAERLCAALLHRSDRNSYINVEDIPNGAISFKVYHRCFGKCDGICTPDMYSYTKPTCIMCLECKGWFSPQKFVGHVHRKVENRTCHWGFDSRNWHDYLHVALDVENRDKYQKILDELKEVEIKETVKAQREMLFMKRKSEMFMDDALLGAPLIGQQLPGGMPTLPQQLAVIDAKQRGELLDIPMKKSKNLDDGGYQFEYQRYQTSLMYAQCAQQQQQQQQHRTGQMSAFRPWGSPKTILQAMQYNAVAALSSLPYLSQEPPVLQNPERVVRSTDRERFERTYQPNVALAPRKSILTKEREKEQRDFRERERERERIERERGREMERIRERERSRERERNREREREREHELEREQRERELQQQQQQQQQQQRHLHHLQQQAPSLPLPLPPPPHQQHVAITNLCESELHIKQERANTPTDMPQSPPSANNSNAADENLSLERRSSGPIMDEEATLPMISPISLSMSQLHHQHHKSNNNNNKEIMQQRRHSLYTSNSSSSSAASTTPPQQQHLPATHLSQASQQQQQQQQQHIHHIAMQQQSYLRQSPHTPSPPNAILRSPEAFSGSNEITSSTSPVPNCNSSSSSNANHNNNKNCHMTNNAQRQQQHGGGSSNSKNQSHTQTIIATVNQHAKLLPTSVSATFTASSNNNNCNSNSNNNNNNNNNEIQSRIRISKNLINQPNIMRSPTPPPPVHPHPATQAPPHHIHQQHPHQHQQMLQQHQQQYEYYKQNQHRLFVQHSSSQHHPQHQQQQQQLLMRHPQQQQQHSPSSSTAAATAAATGLNLSTSAAKVIVQQQPNAAHTHQLHHQQQQNGFPPSSYTGTDFDLLTDIDEESINGELENSYLLASWDTAVEALRDTRPKDRDRILSLLQQLLQERQQLRINNFRLRKMMGNRDAHIGELREQEQHYICQLEAVTRMQQQQNGGNSSVIAKVHSCQADGTTTGNERTATTTRVVPLKKAQRGELKDEEVESDKMTTIATTTTSPNVPTAVATIATTSVVVMKQRQRQRNDQYKIDKCSDSDGDDDKCDSKQRRTAIEVNRNRMKCESEEEENDDDYAAAAAADRREMPKESSSNNKAARQNSLDTESEDDDDVVAAAATTTTTTTTELRKENAEENGGDGSNSSSGSGSGSISELQQNGIVVDNDEDESRFTDANVRGGGGGGGNNSSDSDDDDDDDDDVDDANAQAQAPHSNALVTPPTATTPISPDSAATAGQLFDSSNSSDEQSMKKAQMSASNALAKMSEVGEIDDNDENDDDDSNDDDGQDNEDKVGEAEQMVREQLEKDVAEKHRNSSSNNNNIKNVECISEKNKKLAAAAAGATPQAAVVVTAAAMPRPLVAPATKASKKQTTPTTNCEIQIKKEII